MGREVRRPYDTSIPQPGWAEQDPDDWRESALDALTELMADPALHPDAVAAIGLTGQCPTVAPFDGSRRPVGPGLLYRDNRATDQADAMRRRWGDERDARAHRTHRLRLSRRPEGALAARARPAHVRRRRDVHAAARCRAPRAHRRDGDRRDARQLDGVLRPPRARVGRRSARVVLSLLRRCFRRCHRRGSRWAPWTMRPPGGRA